MELKEFVQQTLIQIADGVADAIQHLHIKDSSAVINYQRLTGDGAPLSKSVEFDVALTVVEESRTAEKSSAGGKAGLLSVASVSGRLDSSDEGGERREAISRVKFSVDMIQPSTIERRPIRTAGSIASELTGSGPR